MRFSFYSIVLVRNLARIVRNGSAQLYTMDHDCQQNCTYPPVCAKCSHWHSTKQQRTTTTKWVKCSWEWNLHCQSHTLKFYIYFFARTRNRIANKMWDKWRVRTHTHTPITWLTNACRRTNESYRSDRFEAQQMEMVYAWAINIVNVVGPFRLTNRTSVFFFFCMRV